MNFIITGKEYTVYATFKSYDEAEQWYQKAFPEEEWYDYMVLREDQYNKLQEWAYKRKIKLDAKNKKREQRKNNNKITRRYVNFIENHCKRK